MTFKKGQAPPKKTGEARRKRFTLRSTPLEIVANINQYGKQGSGKGKLLKYLKGGILTAREAIISKCYDCMGYCADGRVDCEMEQCPLYPWMPYRKKD